MENAAQALKMAAWVLIFVAALSISINAFAQVRQTSDAMIEASDREYLTTYIEESDENERIVSAESIIPTIYRVFDENCKIVFKFKDSDMKLYAKLNPAATGASNKYVNDKVNYIDMEKEKIHDSYKDEFVRLILLGTSKAKDNSYKTYFSDMEFTSNGIWNYIKGKEFKEELGIYYQEETKGGTDTPDANKTEKRVITYTEL